MSEMFNQHYAGDPGRDLAFAFALRTELGDQGLLSRQLQETAALLNAMGGDGEETSKEAASYGTLCALDVSLNAALMQQLPPGASPSDVDQQHVLHVSAAGHFPFIQKGSKENIDLPTAHYQLQVHGSLLDPAGGNMEESWLTADSTAAVPLCLHPLAAAHGTNDRCQRNMGALLSQLQQTAVAAAGGQEVTLAWSESILAKAGELPGQVVAFGLLVSGHYR
jgi:hypothetical protein